VVLTFVHEVGRHVAVEVAVEELSTFGFQRLDSSLLGG